MTPSYSHQTFSYRFLPGILSAILLLAVLSPVVSFSQNNGRAVTPKMKDAIIDSLTMVNLELQINVNQMDSLYQAERFTVAELRDQLMQLETSRKNLEATKTDVEDENLKLNQSNRILIIFNSVVAVLLVITLVFVIKRAGRKNPQTPVVSTLPDKSDNPSTASGPSSKLASFEDKLAQLEKLGGLKEKGILTDEEFQSEKQRILGK
jgi:hypothetical protein